MTINTVNISSAFLIIRASLSPSCRPALLTISVPHRHLPVITMSWPPQRDLPGSPAHWHATSRPGYRRSANCLWWAPSCAPPTQPRVDDPTFWPLCLSWPYRRSSAKHHRSSQLQAGARRRQFHPLAELHQPPTSPLPCGGSRPGQRRQPALRSSMERRRQHHCAMVLLHHHGRLPRHHGSGWLDDTLDLGTAPLYVRSIGAMKLETIEQTTTLYLWIIGALCVQVIAL